MSDERTGWCVILPPAVTGTDRESVYVDASDDADEEHAWRIALGWPTRGEVREAKEAGALAFRCRIVPIEEEQP